MAVVRFVNEGELAAARLIYKTPTVPARQWALHLSTFTGGLLPTYTVADLPQPTWAGYAPRPIDPTEWVGPYLSGAQAVVSLTDQPIQWYGPAGNTEVVGSWFISTDDGQTLLCGAALDNPLAPTDLLPVALLIVLSTRSEA